MSSTLSLLDRINGKNEQLRTIIETKQQKALGPAEQSDLLLRLVELSRLNNELMAEQVRAARQQAVLDSGEIASFPDVGGYVATPSGPIEFDLVEGRVRLPKSAQTMAMSNGLKDITDAKMFRSAFVFCDSHADVIIDKRRGWVCQLGLTALRFNMREKFVINSYLPASLAVMFSTGISPPVQPLTATADFKRYGTRTTTSSTFDTVNMVPFTERFAFGGNGLPDLITTLNTNLLGTNEGIPACSTVKRKTILVQNTTSNIARVKILGNILDSDDINDYAEDSSTGAGVDVAANSFAAFDIPRLYGRIAVQTASKTNGQSTTCVVTLLGSLGAGSG